MAKYIWYIIPTVALSCSFRTIAHQERRNEWAKRDTQRIQPSEFGEEMLVANVSRFGNITEQIRNSSWSRSEAGPGEWSEARGSGNWEERADGWELPRQGQSLKFAQPPESQAQRAQPSVKLASCDRRQSRIVRKVLQQVLYQLGTNQVPLLESCPVHPQRDLFAAQEAFAKTREHSSLWECNVCGKAFIAQRFLDMHLDSRHPNAFIDSNRDDLTCLADYCTIFRCQLLFDRDEQEEGWSPTSTFDWAQALCREEDMRQLHDQCRRLVLGECVAPGGLSEADRALVARRACAHLTCTHYFSSAGEVAPAGGAYYTPAASSHVSAGTLFAYLVAGIVATALLVFYYVFSYVHLSEASALGVSPPPSPPDRRHRPAATGAGEVLFPESLTSHHGKLRCRYVDLDGD